MTHDQQIQGNELIARFMNGKLETDGLWTILVKQNKNPYYKLSTRLAYHKDWNWLIPAIQKWDNLPLTCVSMYVGLSQRLDDAVTGNYDILDAWDQLIKNLNWLNEFNATKN